MGRWCRWAARWRTRRSPCWTKRDNRLLRGRSGEITVTSRYLTSGYWRDPEKTRTRFQPVEDGRGAVRFRTGDLGRWRKDGCLEHLGRKDNQVKIRGFRVDPLAVEAALNRLEIVDQAIVEPYSLETGEFRLMGFVIPAVSPPPDARTLRQELSRDLPEYMIPSEFVLLEAIPLTPNGKADRRALQQMAADRLATPSSTSVEESETLKSVLFGLWRKALRVPSLSEDESFFDLGGNSLSAMELVDDLCRTLRVNLPASVVFEAPTVGSDGRRLAGSIEMPRLVDCAASNPYRIAPAALLFSAGRRGTG